MFDIGFAALLVIGVLGLLVIGPERLPGTVRTVALWIGRLRRSFSDIRSEIEREVGADEIRRQLHNESVLASREENKDQLNKEMNKAGEGLRDIENSIALKQNSTADEKLESKNTPDTEEQSLAPAANEQAPNKQDPTS